MFRFIILFEVLAFWLLLFEVLSWFELAPTLNDLFDLIGFNFFLVCLNLFPFVSVNILSILLIEFMILIFLMLKEALLSLREFLIGLFVFKASLSLSLFFSVF
jgi:hypothetical protein